MSDRANEARLYWRAVSSIRLSESADSVHTTNEHRDDLELLLIHSDWPLVRSRTEAFLTDTREPVAAVAL